MSTRRFVPLMGKYTRNQEQFVTAQGLAARSASMLPRNRHERRMVKKADRLREVKA